MNRYTITAETRPTGAIGIFERRTFTVTAPDTEAAQAAVLAEIYRHNLEPRFITNIQQEPQQ
jgi:hypothetical protein